MFAFLFFNFFFLPLMVNGKGLYVEASIYFLTKYYEGRKMEKYIENTGSGNKKNR